MWHVLKSKIIDIFLVKWQNVTNRLPCHMLRPEKKNSFILQFMYSNFPIFTYRKCHRVAIQITMKQIVALYNQNILYTCTCTSVFAIFTKTKLNIPTNQDWTHFKTRLIYYFFKGPRLSTIIDMFWV